MRREMRRWGDPPILMCGSFGPQQAANFGVNDEARRAKLPTKSTLRENLNRR
jgi:hypothetical protein